MDIVPVSGTLQFISNVRQQQIILSVIADDIPEITEVCKWHVFFFFTFSHCMS